MPEYQIRITATAQKQLNKLPEPIARVLIAVIYTLAQHPRPAGCKKLKGRNGYRIRKGDYRVIYDIEDDVLIVTVIAIGHRREIYD